MADLKISQLPPASVPLAGTEVLPIVQGGSTVQVAVSNLIPANSDPTFNSVKALTFDTNVAAAGVTLVGTTLSADGTDTNIDISVTPKGTGAFSLQVADNTTAGGNKRGTYAVDLQLVRITNTEVASGNYSFAAGYRNTVSGAGALAIGFNITASGPNAVVLGGTCTASAPNSIILGTSSTASGTGNSIAAIWSLPFYMVKLLLLGPLEYHMA